MTGPDLPRLETPRSDDERMWKSHAGTSIEVVPLKISQELERELIQAQARNAALAESLKRFGRHGRSCDVSIFPHNQRCNCGYEKALASAGDTKEA